MSDFTSKEAKAAKEKKRRDELAKAAKDKKEAEKREKQRKRDEEQRAKSAAGSKVEKKVMSREALLAAEREAEEALAEEARLRRKKPVEDEVLAMDTRAAANGAGDELIFEKKISKEEKKAMAAAKRAEKKLSGKGSSGKKKPEGGAAEERDEFDEWRGGAAGGGAPGGCKKSSSKKATLMEKVARSKAELEEELEDARVRAAESRSRLGAYKGALEAAEFTLENPGGGAPLLEGAACTLVRGRSYGLIGRNGKGKSTMLRAFAARRVGNVPPNVTVHYVSQEVHLTPRTQEMTPGECVVAADIERRLLMEEAAELDSRAEAGDLGQEGQERHADVLDRLDMIGAESAERRADELLVNLGFSDELRARPLKALSGGWRVRTMLAAAIFARPDMLLLDEPTNHLSITAVMWLARELSTSTVWKDRIIVVVSHDRYFLDEICSDTLHISGAARRLTQSHGNYTTWATRRAEQQKAYEKEVTLREGEIDRMKAFAGHGFKYGGSSSSINKMKMLEKQAGKLELEAEDQAEELAALNEDLELPILLKAGGALDGFIVQMRGVGFGYPGSPKPLFEGADFGVTSASRIVLLGENGNGKTTLVKLMLGELLPTSGQVHIKSGVRVALVNQHHADQIDLDLTPLQFMAKTFPAPAGVSGLEHLQRLRSHLASCGVTGGSSSSGANLKPGIGNQVMDLQNVPAAALSGGQRSRVALAVVSFTSPHVLVLDEPTNNLDLESVAALAESVKTFNGAVVCVSHDQFFVNAIANEAWVVGNGRVKRVESFEAYRQVQLKRLNKIAPLKHGAS